LRAHEVNLKENGFWDGELARAFRFGDDPTKIPEIKPWVDKITSDRVKAAASKYLQQKQYVLGVLQPEAVSTAPSGGGKTASTPQLPEEESKKRRDEEKKKEFPLHEVEREAPEGRRRGRRRKLTPGLRSDAR
jgi:hypothetical protein